MTSISNYTCTMKYNAVLFERDILWLGLEILPPTVYSDEKGENFEGGLIS